MIKNFPGCGCDEMWCRHRERHDERLGCMNAGVAEAKLRGVSLCD